MRDHGIKILAQRQWSVDGVEIGIFEFSDSGGRVVRSEADPITFKPMADGECANGCLRISEDAAIELMDSLWQQGIRPKDKSYGSLQSVTKHLDDMRAIAFHKLGIKK